MKKNIVWLFAFCLLLSSCSVNKQIGKIAKADILNDSNLAQAHVGISLYDASEKKYVYNYQGDKYFIPASNTKLLMCYAAMKYLGDSLVGLRYEVDKNGRINIQGTGDPTFLHPDFTNQPVYNFLNDSKNYISITPPKWRESALGNGWAWNDYDADYMAERSEFPIYGNVAKFSLHDDTISVSPKFLYDDDYGWIKKDNQRRSYKGTNKLSVKRNFESNIFRTNSSTAKFTSVEIPFKTDILPILFKNDLKHIKSLADKFMYALLEDTLHKSFAYNVWIDTSYLLPNIIHSQPTDSLLKITMHRSDNFFAEQTLLMVSNEKLGVMSDAKIIDDLLKSDYKDMPQKPKWVDGSGLSRYNLISPQDFVFVLEKMKNEFDWKRITTILPTGDDGTLKGLYKNYAGKIYAKTGTISNNLALSGYVITNKGKQFIFSVMVNNHQASATAIRKSIEKFLTTIIDKY